MLTLEWLAELAQTHREALGARVREFDVAGRLLAFNSKPAIMGVVNLSADSWYRESVCLSAEQAIRRGQVLAAQGADIIDVGAESTLAHAVRKNSTEQNGQLLPVLSGLRAAGIPVSVETYEMDVARDCLDAGASVLNLTRGENLETILKMVAEHNAAVVLCFVQGEHVRAVGDLELGADPVGLMYEYFARRIDLATRMGVSKIMIDPGLGFYYRNLQDSAVRVRHQMRTFVSSFRLRTLGWPVCQALPHAFEYFGEEVRCAEPFFAVLAALGKTDVFRTHEVPRIKAVLDTLAAF